MERPTFKLLVWTIERNSATQPNTDARRIADKVART